MFTLFKKLLKARKDLKYGRVIEFYEGAMPCGANKEGELEVLCPECNEWINRQEFLREWDWSGPNCPNCGAGGMSYFAKVQGPVSSGREILNKYKH